jgi:hypothetical protein
MRCAVLLLWEYTIRTPLTPSRQNFYDLHHLPPLMYEILLVLRFLEMPYRKKGMIL